MFIVTSKAIGLVLKKAILNEEISFDALTRTLTINSRAFIFKVLSIGFIVIGISIMKIGIDITPLLIVE